MISYTYNSRGLQTGSSSGNAELQLGKTIIFDDYGRVAQIDAIFGTETNTFHYNYLYGSAMVSSITNNLGFGISKYYEDNRNLIIGVSNYFGSSPISSFIYENDAIGRRTERLDFDENLLVKTNSFAYNHYSEVTNAFMNTDNYNFTMDDIGNRTEHVINDIPAEYYGDYPDIHGKLNHYSDTLSANLVYNQNFAFDLDGNMISITQYDLNDTRHWLTWQYTWNAENRMTSATNSVDGTYVTYKYDYQGRMFEKTTNGDTTRFIWNGNHIIAEFSEASTNLYVWANGEILTASLNGETVFYCHDANKNVTDLVDTSGDSVVHYEYSPFGVITEQTGSLAAENPFRFSNEYFDETTGFVEYKRRPYIPPLGKFASRDPIGIRGGQNEYMFCNNNAINFWDYLGREPKRPKPADYEILDLSSFVKWRYELVYRLGNLPPLKPETRVQNISLPRDYPARRYRNVGKQKKKSSFGCWKAYYLTVYAEPILGFNSKGSIGSPFDSRKRLRFEPQIAIVEKGGIPSQYSKTWSKPGMMYMGIIGLKTTGKYLTYKNYRWDKGETSIQLDIHRRIKRTYLDNFLDDEEIRADERAFRNVPVISDNDKIQKLEKLTFELNNNRIGESL